MKFMKKIKIIRWIVKLINTMKLNLENLFLLIIQFYFINHIFYNTYHLKFSQYLTEYVINIYWQVF